jgi:glycosyltransferase involved in cell wall biosynthesis
MHEIKTFLQWIENFDGYDNISIKFHTSGSLKSKFENQALSILNAKNLKNNIYFGDSLQATEWLDVMMDADVGLVFQDSGAGSIVFPSKIVNMLASGQAVLAIAEKSSEIGKLILNNDCGWVVEPGDIDYLNNVLASLTDSKMLRQKRINAYKFCKSYFGIETVAARWDAVFNEVAG